MARMLGVVQRDWCPVCHGPAGLDCPSTARGKRAERKRENRRWRREEAEDGAFAASPVEGLLHDVRRPHGARQRQVPAGSVPGAAEVGEASASGPWRPG